MNKDTIISISAIVAFFAVVGFGVYLYQRPPQSAEIRRIEEYQAKVVELEKQLSDAKSTMRDLEVMSNEAEKRAAASAKMAANWRKKYNEIDSARKIQPKAKSGNEALNELRREGWIR